MLYLFHGPDAFSRSEEIARIKHALGDPGLADLNTILLDGRQIGLPELIHACDTLPFLAERRLVIVEGLLASFASGGKGRKEREEREKQPLEGLVAYLERLPPTTDLVLVEDEIVAATHPVHRLAAAPDRGQVKSFPELRERELGGWIQRRAQAKGIGIEPCAAQELAAFVGNNLCLLDQELTKLASYVGHQGIIRLEDVRRLVSYVREQNIFEFVDALGSKEAARAIRSLHQLLAEGKEPLYILAMVTRQFRLLAQTKDLVARRIPHAELFSVLGIRPEFLRKKLLAQARNFSLPQLQALYRDLQRMDAAIKAGEIDSDLALDLFVARACARA